MTSRWSRTSPTSTTRSTWPRASRGCASEELAREMTELYRADTDRLGLGRPDSEPLASETLAEIVALIEALIEAGHAYPSGGDVYFSVRSFDGYGKLSNRRLEDLAPQDQGEPEEEQALKRDPLDFALWKAHKPDEDTAWDSPWGRGRPGLAHRVLGDGGEGPRPRLRGARRRLWTSCSRTTRTRSPRPRRRRGQPLARIWMHNGMIRFGEEKMAKSVGNVTTARRRARPPRPRRADRVLPRGPLPAAAGLLGRADGGGGPGAPAADRVRPAARARRRPCDRRARARGGGAAGRVLRRAAGRLQHAPGAGRRCSSS